jgi:outer membrane protein OmpA-like peptidoglycan-associated protein
MKAIRLAGIAGIAILPLLGLVSVMAVAQTNKVEGFIKSRSGPDMVRKTSQDPDFVVLLTKSTDVGQVQGLFKARRKEMSMAALIPGLAVTVEGRFNNQHVFAARKVRFKGDDLKQAEAIEAGMHDVKMQVQQNQAELDRQNAELKAQNEALQKHQAAIEANQAKIAANKAAVEAASARFGQLDDYYIMDQMTVYFGNGKVNLEPQYVLQLVTLAQKAHLVEGYMIEVKGYASASGSAAVNQQLSEDRADNVTNILLQQGKLPLTRMLAPGAMGESEQVGNEKNEEGQAENRRVVVRVLQNKAIAGV